MRSASRRPCSTSSMRSSFPAGNDIAPESYGQTGIAVDRIDLARDRFEVALVRGALEKRRPVLGICRGMQLINVAHGGTLHNCVCHADAEDAALPGLHGARAHVITLLPDSLVARAVGQGEIEAICMHHQAVDKVARG